VHRFSLAVGPAPTNLAVTFALQLQALFVYLIFLAPHYFALSGVCVTLVFALNTFFLLRAAFTEPGMVPRAPDSGDSI